MDLFDRVFILNHNFLSWVGLGYNQTYRKRLIRYYIFGFMSLYTVLSQICPLLTLDGDLFSAVPKLQICISSICLVVVYGAGVVDYITVCALYSYMKRDWGELKSDVELQIMQKHAYITKVVTLIIASMFYLYIIIAVSPSLLRIILSTNEVRRDIDYYPIMSCFDYFLDRQTYYYPIIIYQIIALAAVAMVSIACYSAYFLFIQHICAQLCIIKCVINRQLISNDHNNDLPEIPVDLSQWVINIVQRLARTTECMSLLNAAYEKVYLVETFFAFILLVIDFLCLFQIPVLLQNKESKEHAMASISFIFGSLFPIYINYYIGQRLIDYSVDVYKEACLIPIHNLSLKTQKLLLTTLMISSKPLAISIGKIYVSSHEFFSDLIRSSLSFAMVLRSLQRN